MVQSLATLLRWQKLSNNKREWTSWKKSVNLSHNKKLRPKLTKALILKMSINLMTSNSLLFVTTHLEVSVNSNLKIPMSKLTILRKIQLSSHRNKALWALTFFKIFWIDLVTLLWTQCWTKPRVSVTTFNTMWTKKLLRFYTTTIPSMSRIWDNWTKICWTTRRNSGMLIAHKKKRHAIKTRWISKPIPFSQPFSQLIPKWHRSLLNRATSTKRRSYGTSIE